MDRETGKSWERYGRRFVLRLSLKRPEEVAVMDEYDRRSKLLGKDDKEFLKNCLIVGCRTLLNKDISSNTIALSTNESNNTQKEHKIFPPVLANESHDVKTHARQLDGNSQQEKTQRSGDTPEAVVTPAKSVLGGLMKHA